MLLSEGNQRRKKSSWNRVIQLVTYAASPVKSTCTVDYIIVREEDKAKVHNVKIRDVNG